MQRTASRRIATPLGERASMMRLRQIQEQRAGSTPYTSDAVDRENVDPSNYPAVPFSLPKVVTPAQLVYLPKFRGKHPDLPGVHARTKRRALEPKSPHANSYFNLAQGSTGFTLEGSQGLDRDMAADQSTKETQGGGRSSARTSDESLRIIDLDPTQRYSPLMTRNRPLVDSGEDNDEDPSQSDSVLETQKDPSSDQKDPSNGYGDPTESAVVSVSALQRHEQDHTPTYPPRRPRTLDPLFDNPIVARLVTPEEFRVAGFRSRRSMFNLTTVLDGSDTLTMTLPATSKAARSLSEPTPGVSSRG
ncbi:hypothetical protein BG000_005061 [Podila horticola]|nr:hypothetical protein BG000_005061 [Podila horticola]